MTSLARRLFREPLTHFVLIGAVLFVGFRLVHGPGADRSVVVSREVRASLVDAFSRGHGRNPTDEELTAEVDRWVDDEVLFRTGVERGIDRDDPLVRQRIVAKMSQALSDGAIAVKPSDDELRQYFDAHRGRYAKAEQVDFTQVFVEGRDDASRARAQDFLATLSGGADPAGLGDTFSGGRRYRQRKLADLATTFGDEFAVGLDDQPVGTWELRPSKLGFHLVRVDKRSAPREPSFEEAKADVTKDFGDDARAAQVERALRELRAHWNVVDR